MDASLNTKLKAIIFDLDGTLVSSYLNFFRIREEISCPENMDILHYLQTLSGQEKSTAEAIIHKHEQADINATEAMPGIHKLLANLNSNKFQIGVVTRNSASVTQAKLTKTNIFIEDILTRDCAPPKPDPAALLQLAHKWKLNPAECMYVGDYLYDLQAAKNAKMASCLYTQPPYPHYAHLADIICHHYDEFLDLI